jgi:hypothetical protein
MKRSTASVDFTAERDEGFNPSMANLEPDPCLRRRGDLEVVAVEESGSIVLK